MDFVDLTKPKVEPYEEHFSEYEEENIGEKCGLVYRTSSNFIYKCLSCTLTFVEVEEFRIHILRNHDQEATKIESNEDENAEFEPAKNDDSVDDEADYKVIFKNQLLEQHQDSVVESSEANTLNNSRRSTRKRKFSETENSDSVKILPVKVRTVNRFKWQIDKIFPNESDAQNYILSKKIWSFLHQNFTKKGIKRYYRCNRVKFRGQQCASSILYFLNKKSGKCEVYISNSEHTCDIIGALQSNSQITAEIKTIIEDLYEKGIKLKDIVNKAEKEYNVKSGQVKHFLKLLKVKKEKSLKLELENWIRVSRNLPQSPTLPFVVNSESDESSLRFFISSKNLLSNAKNISVININGVKKLNWHTYTIFFPGTVNESKFKCFGVAVCQSDGIDDFIFIFKNLKEAVQKYFNLQFAPVCCIRDSNINVETAFQKSFHNVDIKTKICWNHVRNRLKIKLEYLLPEHHNKKEEILGELDQIQKSNTFEEFKEAIDEFANKWALYVEFVTYFHQEWIDKNFNWYEGIDQNYISSNIFLDAMIKQIQNDDRFRERLPFSLFKNQFFEWIARMSHTTTLESREKSSDVTIKAELAVSQNTVSFIQENLKGLISNPSANTSTISTTIRRKGPKTSYKTTISPKTSILKVPQNERKKRSEKLWKEENTFKSLIEAEIAVESEKIWSLSTKNRTKAGTKIYFRCNRVPFRGVQCDAGIYLFLKSDSTDVVLVRSGLPHTCHEIAFKSRGIEKDIRAEIERLNDLSWKPSQILDYIQGQNYEASPTKTQISNYLAVLRERKYGALNLNQIKYWLKNYTQIPDNDTKMFIVTHESTNNEHHFFFSSKRLLQNAINIKFIHADDVHKLEWIKFPIYFIGATDIESNFCFLGIVMGNGDEQTNFEFIFKSLKDGIFRIFNYIVNPNVSLITDTNYKIHLAFKNVFEEGQIKICWDLIRKNIKKKLDELGGFTKENNADVQKDLEALYRNSSDIEFNEKLTTFTTKWSDHREFIKYFNEEWKHVVSSPMTNTKLETFVKSFKSDQLFRKKIPLESFNKILNKSIKAWSLNCNNF